MLLANYTKKGYYVKRLKEALWSTFGISKIRPFKDMFSKEMMKEWKSSEAVRVAHEELYNPSDLNNPTSDTYISLIIQSIFISKECTKENAFWAQSVLEAVFDEKYLDSKIDTEIVDKWNKNLLMVNGIQYI